MMRFFCNLLCLVLLISDRREVWAVEPEPLPLSAREVLDSLEDVSSPNREMLAKLRQLSQRDFATRLEVFRLSLGEPRFAKSAWELSGLLNATLGLEDDPRPFAIAIVTSMVNTKDDAVFCALDELLGELKPAVPSELLQPAVQSMMRRIRETQFREHLYVEPKTLIGCATSQEMEPLAEFLTERITAESDTEARETMLSLLRRIAQQHRSLSVEPISQLLLKTFEKHQFTAESTSDFNRILYFGETVDPEIVIKAFEILRRGLQRNSPDDRRRSLRAIAAWSFLHVDDQRNLPRIDEVRSVTRLLVDHLQEEVEAELRDIIHLQICHQATRFPVSEGQEYLRAVVRSAAVENNLKVFQRALSELSKAAGWLESDDVRVLLKSRIEGAALGEWSVPYGLLERLSDEHADELTAIALTKLSQVTDEASFSEWMGFIPVEQLTLNRKAELTRELMKLLDAYKEDRSLVAAIIRRIDGFGNGRNTSEMDQIVEQLLTNEELNETPTLGLLAFHSGRMSEDHFQRYWALVTRHRMRPSVEPDPVAMSRLMEKCIDRLSPQERQIQSDWYLSQFEEHGTPLEPVLEAVLKSLDEMTRKKLASDCVRMAHTCSRDRISDLLQVMAKMPEESVSHERNQLVRMIVSRLIKSEFSGDSPYQISGIADAIEPLWNQCDDEPKRHTILELAQYLGQNEQPYDCQGLAPAFGRMAESVNAETKLAALLFLLPRMEIAYRLEDNSLEFLSPEFDRLSMSLDSARIDTLGVRMVELMQNAPDEKAVTDLGDRLSRISRRVSADTARRSLRILYDRGGQGYIDPSLRILIEQKGVIPDAERRIAFLDILKDPALDRNWFEDFARAASDSELFWRFDSSKDVVPIEWKLELVRWATNPNLGGRYKLDLSRQRVK